MVVWRRASPGHNHPDTRFLKRFAESSGGLPPPSPPAEKATARQDQAGQSSTGDGGGHAHTVERKGRVKRWTRCRIGANDGGADPQPVRVQHLIACPTLKIGEAAGERRSRWHNGPRCREPKKVS